MNVYDFDKTIYTKDSSIELYKFVCKKNPTILFKCLPGQMMAWLKYKLHCISKEQLKEKFFMFLQYIHAEEVVAEFVSGEMRYISDWYLKQKKTDDLIISASPYFLVKCFAVELGITNVIASDVDIKTGKFNGKNCYGKEKVKRFEKEYANKDIDEFYSDSKSDIYLAMKAERAFLIKRGEKNEWELGKNSENNC